ncbi:MAG TPA: pyridoxamine 5'-phosphate oxidase family protein [Alcaligenes sp.]|nr:pyridoxamine 5'-phosphate oxidase family protein [Alcaligenes sp.]HRL26924.1 pyridoxamine 5'-phosphate oxidase family protein [Alcaligenes sp.]
MTDLNFPTDSPIEHEGELEMRRRFPSSYQWDEYNIKGMVRNVIHPGFARFIEALPFFFIATANQHGHCDASYRGCETSKTGKLLPPLKVIDEKTLIFPDYSGNGLYNSLGNILTNPHIGMLFIDFSRRTRVRLNGIAHIFDATPEILQIWPDAQAYVQV